MLPERRRSASRPSAWKASAGTLARLPVARATNLVRTLTSYAEAGLMIAGLDGRGEIDLDALELATGPLVLVVGAEGKGLSRLVRETCDLTVRIPLSRRGRVAQCLGRDRASRSPKLPAGAAEQPLARPRSAERDSSRARFL